ncbi:MAG: hypothetical protein AB9869_00445 [Verrucomicrobiia bacterium]
MDIGSLLVILLGIGTLLLGLKAFSKAGLPVTYSKRLHGRVGMLIGAVCVVLGAVWLIVGIWLGAGAPTQ